MRREDRIREQAERITDLEWCVELMARAQAEEYIPLGISSLKEEQKWVDANWPNFLPDDYHYLLKEWGL